jgi:hypothetical protein
MINRRNFLRNFGLAGAVLAADPILAGTATQRQTGKNDLANLTLKGRVHSNGKGLANVAVTDGFNVVVTDSKGNYQLLSNNTAEFVHISIPSGYAFPADKGIARFYQPITQKQGEFKADFSLDKLEIDDRKHHFVVWADTQMISKADAEQLKAQSVPDLRDLVQSYPKGALFHGIGCGDLVWDHFELFEDYKHAIGMTGVTFFNVIGNHDMDIDSRSDDYAANTFKKQFGPTYYSFNRGDIHYVTLDDVFFIGAGKKYIGYITENQLQWLEQDLAHVKPGSTVVVSLHIPTNTGAARRTKSEESIGGVVSNREQLYKILKPYKVHIMSGHTHFNEHWEKDNIMEHNHGTVCGAWWTGPICGDGTPSGYGVYEVDGSELKWYYKSTGFDKDHQVNIYPKGKAKEYPDEVVANVWNWDPKWKVEWYEDGVMKGLMEQRISNDPWAVELYAGPSLPQKHKFVEPTKADHLFVAKPSAGAKEIMVKATDRFGNIYQKTFMLT